MRRAIQLIAIMALPLAACDGGGVPPRNGAAPSGHDSELRFISAAAIDTLDPQGTSWLIDFRMIECLFEPLLRVRPDNMALEPAAATSWEVSPDGLVYTFHLRPEARWSNGDPVKAGDFIYGWQRALLYDFAADYSGMLFCIKGAKEIFDWRGRQLKGFAAIRNAAGGPAGDTARETAEQVWQLTRERFAQTVGIEALDDFTLEVTLRQPTAYFLELCAFATLMPVHETSASAAARINASTGRLIKDSTYFSDPYRLVSNGAYVLREWIPKLSMTLEQNPRYWNRSKMGNRRIVQLVVEDPGTAMLKYTIGEVDWLPDIPTNLKMAADLVAQNRSDVHTGPAAGTYFYLFNCRPQIDGASSPLADPRVRRALSMTIDRQTIVDKITRMRQPVARSFVPPGAIAGYAPPVEAGMVFDPETARQLLADAGFPGGEGPMNLSILYNNEGGHEVAAQVIAKMWKDELGIAIKLEGVEKNRFRQRRRKGDFTIARGGWFGDYRDPTTFLEMFLANDGNNDGGYANPAYDAKLAQAATEADPARRMAILREAEAMMLRDQPLAPIYQYVNLDVFDPAHVKNLTPNLWNYRRLEWVTVQR